MAIIHIVMFEVIPTLEVTLGLLPDKLHSSSRVIEKAKVHEVYLPNQEGSNKTFNITDLHPHARTRKVMRPPNEPETQRQISLGREAE